jgi:hypothetical protein
MLLLGCRPKGRNTEQHDIFFTIGDSLAAIVPDINAFWPEVKGNIHIDAWREVTTVDGFAIQIEHREAQAATKKEALFFINLGGYKENEFEEYHYKVLVVAKDAEEAKMKAKSTMFYKHCGFKGAPSHIDDKYGVDVDEIYKIEDILPAAIKEKYRIKLTEPDYGMDEMHLGYLPVFRIKGQ